VVKGIIKFNRIKMSGIIVEPFSFRLAQRIKHPFPMRIMPARRPNPNAPLQLHDDALLFYWTPVYKIAYQELNVAV
jgi:hypothetical protein